MWTTETIAGKQADVFEPTGPARPRFGLLFLSLLRARPVYTRLLEELRLACVCPHADSSWWTDRLDADFDPHLSAEKYLLQHVLPFFHERWRFAPGAVGIGGIGRGGQGALRLAFRHAKSFPVAVGIAPALDYYELYGQGTSLDAMYDSKEQCRQDTALMHVHPYEHPRHLYYCVDPDDAMWFRGGDRLHEKLGALGVDHTAELTTTAGAGEDYADRMAAPALRFLVAGLEKEGRRLL
jgi:hypothetical protein